MKSMNDDTPKKSFENISNRYAERVDSKAIHVYYERPNLLALLPDDIKDLNILDLGCGSGWYSEYLAHAGANVTALDASPTLVEMTKQRVKGNAKVYLADLEQPLDFLVNQKFDIIIAPLVIHYIKDWLPLFSNLSKLLIEKGLFVFSTHSPHSEFYLRQLDNYYEKTLIADHWKDIGEVHFYHHTLQELTESLRQAGLSIDRMLEPAPGKEMQAADPEMFKVMMNKPWFLFVKAVKA